MNDPFPMNDELSDDVQFDRLVDGELSDVEREQLLSSLDERPDGWRRCALAFLESQTWRQELGHLVREPNALALELDAQAMASARNVAVDRPANDRQATWWLSLAASVFVAFTLGMVASGSFRSDTDSIAQTETLPNPAMSLAENGAMPEEIPDAALAEAPVSDALTFWVRDEHGKTRPLRVPLVESRDLDRRLGTYFPSALSSDVRHQLQTNGYDVHSKRRYAPLVIENGQPLLVPVEDTKIVPVDRPVY